MLCYEVMLNGARLCVAGVPDGVLVGALTSTGSPSTEPQQSRVSLRVGGIFGDAHVDWALEPLTRWCSASPIPRRRTHRKIFGRSIQSRHGRPL